jgi:hypothetical protein
MTQEKALYRKVIGVSAIGVGAIGILGAVVAGVVDGSRAAYGATLGGVAALVVAIASPAAMLVSHRRAPWAFAFSVATAWAIAILVVAAIFAQARDLNHAPRLFFIGVFGCGVLVELVARVVLTARSRVPYVEPGSP